MLECAGCDDTLVLTVANEVVPTIAISLRTSHDAHRLNEVGGCRVRDQLKFR